MFLIGLSGGEPAERERVADNLVTSGKVCLSVYAMRPPMARPGESSARRFRNVNGEARAEQLAVALGGLNGKIGRSTGLILSHCLSAEEAKIVRDRGGEVWHLYGQAPSELVPIRREDRMINPYGPAYKHVLAPLEALSEYMLATGLARSGRARA